MSYPPAARGGSREVDAATGIPIERLLGQPFVLMLDVDGTLAPIAPNPSLARVPPETRRIVTAFVARPDAIVALVSGRAAHDARRLVGVEKLWTIGNHGAELVSPDGETSVHPAVARYREEMALTARALEPLLAPFDGVMLENKTWTLSVHYRIADDGIVPRLRAIVDDVVRRNGLRLTEGKKVLEIRPPVPVDKGTAIHQLAADLGALGDGASLFFGGDDATDEDAFRLLRVRCPEAVTVQVGTQSDTSAGYVVATPDDLRRLLERVARYRDRDLPR